MIRLIDSVEGVEVNQVEDNKEWLELKNTVLSFWINTRNDYFPGPQPVSLDRNNIPNLEKYAYKACMKYDGDRFMMLCTTFHGENCTFLVDRTFRFFKLYQNWDPVIYKNSLWDGELVKNKSTWVYVIHDCIALKGENISQENLEIRLNALNKSLGEDLDTSHKADLTIQSKKFVNLENIEDLVKLYTTDTDLVNYKTDGIIFTPIKKPVGTGTFHPLKKWKPCGSHTFDFKLNERHDRYIIQAKNKGEIISYASIQKNSKKGMKFSDRLTEIKASSGNIIECTYDENEEIYVPFCVRKDKTHPNNLITIDKTHNNIYENIKIEEFYGLKTRN